MPTSGTHVTIVQRLAAMDPALQRLLGDPLADDSTDAGRQMRFANLGAVGPDVFYAMADYDRGLQDLENFLVKVGGTFECISELMGKLDRYIGGIESEITFGIADSLKESATLIQGVVKQFLVGLIADAGFNFWPVFESRRQQDQPRERWFWADYLHYIRTGRFARALLDQTKQGLDAEPSQRNRNLRAYALGYLTHYVTDVVGHPYVNQVVQAPWRLYWQRHHLVENFIDTYVWDRWHVARPAPAPPSTEEQPLDAISTSPNATGSGAPYVYARLNDHIAIGIPSVGDPVDQVVQKVCDAIDKGLFDLGIAEDTGISGPDDEDFRAWTALVAQTLRAVYADTRHPMNLGGDGFPTEDDIAAAYGTIRLFLKLSTEEKIQEPRAPDILGDIGGAAGKFFRDLQHNLDRFPPVNLPSFDGDFSWDALWDAILGALEWIADFGAALIETVFDAIVDLINIAGTIVSEPVKFILYLLNKWLFSIYRQLRDVMVLAANAVPFTEELSLNMGGPLNTRDLWRSPGEAPEAGKYPVEEIDEERAYVSSSYAPFRPPNRQNSNVELPPVAPVAPYRPHGNIAGAALTMPDDFIDAPLGPDDMFQASGPQPPVQTSDHPPLGTFDSRPRNFGGAIANCQRAIQLAEQGFPDPYLLPDYNLDGDRGYAWPCWDVAPPPAANPDNSVTVSDPLDPDRAATPGVARVNAVPVTG